MIDGHSMGSDYAFSIWTDGNVQIEFSNMRRGGVFSDRRHRETLARQLDAIDGISIPEHRVDGNPRFPLAVLMNPDSMRLFLTALDGMLETIRVNT